MKKIIYSVVLFLAFTLTVFAEYNIVNDVGFNYGGDKNDRFYDLDFFEDGGYVAVGESESTFRNITNQGNHSDGIIAVFDKNNNLIKEWSWNNGEFDGVIMSFNPVLAENQDDDEPIEIIDDDKEKDSLDSVEEKDTSTVDNPKTGTFIGLGIGLLFLIILTTAIINKNKKKMYKI